MYEYAGILDQEEYGSESTNEQPILHITGSEPNGLQM